MASSFGAYIVRNKGAGVENNNSQIIGRNSHKHQDLSGRYAAPLEFGHAR
jgi:hypothetical protein